MTKNKAGNEGIGDILGYLDREIETFRQNTGNYPNLILISKETKNKLFTELEKENFITNSWKDSRDNYRGIKIEIRDIDFLKLE
jgi:hypothetical protein